MGHAPAHYHHRYLSPQTTTAYFVARLTDFARFRLLSFELFVKFRDAIPSDQPQNATITVFS
ncbi:MAG: hypothetical protein M0Z99_01070, partial [Betaproteobacteria bacterium]|nr:hypothetical protein [Betaproteobacteria bacterium]